MIAVALKSHEIAKAGKFLEVLKACQTTIPRASHCDGRCGIMPFDESQPPPPPFSSFKARERHEVAGGRQYFNCWIY